jgi:inosose dehydratase
MGFTTRLAGAPISWGVCEVPGWGVELPVERVLGEMQQLGLGATELGSDGYLPTDPAHLHEVCARFDLEMIGGFVPVVVHDPDERQATIDATHRAASLMSAAGGTYFISSAVASWDWDPPHQLGDREWSHSFEMLGRIDEIVTGYGMVQAIHPHLGTQIETRDDVLRVLDGVDIGWTFDTGHLLIGGMDPLEFARDAFANIRHVHLKDVHLEIARPVVAGEMSLMHGVQAGMFCNLGQGDVPIGDVVAELESAGYDQWYVLEQDAAITSGLPAVGSGPMLDVQASIDYLKGIEASVSAA